MENFGNSRVNTVGFRFLLNVRRHFTTVVLAVFAFTLTLAVSSWAATTEKVLYSFTGNTGTGDGSNPQSALTSDAKGNLYGTTASGGFGGGLCPLGGCGTVYRLTPTKKGGFRETVLYTFQGELNDGQNPSSGVVLDAAGNLYGITGGGLNGCGIVYKLTPTKSGPWAETILHTFDPFNQVNDGCDQLGERRNQHLIFDKAGNLYGSTAQGGGGVSTFGCFIGCGTVFKMTPNSDGTWRESVIHRYPSQGKTRDGFGPAVNQIDSAGNLYGTAGGGPCQSCAALIFKLTPAKKGDWPETVLYQSHITDLNTMLIGGLFMDKAGNFFAPSYGPVCTDCAGAIVEVSPTNGKYKARVIHSFNSKKTHNDGFLPQDINMIMDSAGNLYATTFYGGGNVGGCTNFKDGDNGCGSVYELSPNSDGTWSEKILAGFDDGPGGGLPEAENLLLDAQGNLYGTAMLGGITNSNGTFNGVVFEIKR